MTCGSPKDVLLWEGGQRMKLLFLTSDKFPPFRPAAKAIFTDEFRRRGHRVDWLIQAEKTDHQRGKITTQYGDLFVAPTSDNQTLKSRIGKYIYEFANNMRVIYLPFRKSYDLIQVKDRYISAVIALVIAKLTRTPYFHWLAYPHAEAHALEAREGFARYPVIYRFRAAYQSFLLYKILMKYADHSFVQSEQMKRDISELGIAPESMTAVPGSVTLSEVPYVAPENYPAATISKDRSTETVIYVGTLIRERHLEFLIQSFAHTKRKRPNAQLRIVGKGENPEDENLLTNEVRRLGLEDAVQLVGQLPPGEVFPEIANSQVCVSPYYPSWILNSTSPTKLIEYLAMGKPVVGNEHPEQSEVIAASGAGLIAPWEERAFGDCIAELLAQPERATQMGESGRQWVEENRTNQHLAEVVEQTYHRVISLRSKSTTN